MNFRQKILKKSFIIIFIVAAVAVLTYAGGYFIDNGAEEDKVIILHTNDEHGEFENLGQIAYLKNKYEKKYTDVFLVSAGDIFGGNPVVDQYQKDGQDLRGKPIVALMNRAGYDVLTVGNHEFDYGQKRLQEVRDQTSFSFIAANIICEKGAVLEPLEPYTVLEADSGRKVAFLGLLQVGPGGIPSTHPANLDGLSFSNPFTAAGRYMYLDDKSDLFVGLTHLGYDQDHMLAERFSRFDLLVGGHSHTVLEEPELVNDVLITQAGSHTEYLGKIVIEYGPDDEIAKRRGQLIPVDEISGTVKEIEDEIKMYREEMAPWLQESLIALPDSIQGRSALGSLICDAVAAVHGTDLAFQQDGGIRKHFLSGTVTRDDIYRLLPFANNIIIYRMSSRDVKKLIRDSYSRYQELGLRVSGPGYRVMVDSRGEVIDVSLKVEPEGLSRSPNITDQPLQNENEGEKYLVGMNSYLAESYSYITDNCETVKTTSYTTAETVIEYLNNLRGSELSSDFESRTRVQESEIHR